MSEFAAVVVGAAIGAPARFLVERALGRAGLILVNVLGSALAGVAAALASGALRTFLLVGLCGAFTTFSGFAHAVLGERRPGPRSALALVLPLACVAAFALAWAAGSALAAG